MEADRLLAMRPDADDVRAALVELGLTTAFMFVVFSLVRWGIGTAAPDATATELRVRVTVVSTLVGLLIVRFIISRPGRFSGAHMNPAITVALFAFGRTPARRVLPYLAAQVSGSVAAAALTRIVWGEAVSNAPVRWAVVQPGAGWTAATVVVIEAVVMAIIVWVMCWRTIRGPGRSLAWIMGGMFGLQGAVLGTLTGGSANPARQIGPALFSGQTHLLAAYLLAPIVGGVIAGWAVRCLACAPARPVPQPRSAPQRASAGDTPVRAQDRVQVEAQFAGAGRLPMLIDCAG